MLVSAWLSLQSQRLLDDGEIATMIPIGKRTDYLIAAMNIDKHLVESLGASLEAHVGADLHSSDAVWGADAALTWRLSRTAELSFFGGVGSTLGRSDSSTTSGRLRLQLLLRW